MAVLPVPTDAELRLDDLDLEWRTCRGSGAGGQHRNKTDSAVQLTHRPSGTTVRVETERSQHRNRALALDALRSRMLDQQQQQHAEARAGARRQQVGSGQRGDKVRTYREQDDVVTDARTGRKARLRDVIKGDIRALA